MLIRKAFKYKLKTSAKTEAALAQFAGCNRFVWNKALAIQKERLEKKEYCKSFFDLSKDLAQWKKDEEQRKLARKVKGSKNFSRQKCKVQLVHSKIAATRNDYLHKVSTTLSKNHAMVVLEDLNIANMSKSAAGTKNEPGKNVRAKAGLNRAILDQGWFAFRQMLEYKMAWQGGEVVSVDARYTSQRCSKCSHTDKQNRPSQAVFDCALCGFKDNADLNAAQNILAAGHAVLACGDIKPIAA